jgi:hypothetical protein
LQVPFVAVGPYQYYNFWQFPIKTKAETKKGYLKLLTGMGSNRKNAMVVKIFGTSVTGENAFDQTIKPPENFVNVKDENPPPMPPPNQFTK